MKDKRCDIETAIAKIPNGASVMVSGFGSSGTPFSLIDELINQGQQDLTIIKNDANEDGIGIDKLVKSGQVKKIYATHIGLNPTVMKFAESGEMDVELIPQGIMAERIRCAGVGLPGFLSTIGFDIDYGKDKSIVEVEGEKYIFEKALSADFALVRAEIADSFGNMRFNTAGINFAPLMSQAADVTIVEAKQVVKVGEINPEDVHASGISVDIVSQIIHYTEEYDPIRR
ncbi:MAG: CoA transferase subunit A [Candidatus Marinimicrobia bacterium]|nr:CoA transferase subunit A [Candidatus Neomarinimicrobiota bacterium]MBL7010296.1 CoA transferase subunit A [Candidatus Neomarinimicrobiota bacterium]MBL7030551.1 CoA transferase subunit A [Candidatus Neomarinimicrobiota bacterium]